MIGAIGSRAPSFISPGNLVEMFNDTAILIILALGQMMVLLTKGIDLSMAANLALTGMIVALLNAHYPGSRLDAAGAGDPAGPADGDDQRPAGLAARHSGHCGDAGHHEHLPRHYLPALRRRLG
jgi:ribose/xylose/arabinose/galactoside ABC-type transport system permease subunit